MNAEKPKQPYKNPLGRINKPSNRQGAKQHYQRIACVFQGGGALGAFQVGAFRAIHEHYQPNYYAGVSIGAINCAIIAGNPPEKQVDKLLTFWDNIAPNLLVDYTPFFDFSDFLHHFQNQLGASQALFYGIDGFFRPRLIPPNVFTQATPDELSYYDLSPLRTTLEELIDFDLINAKKVTLCIGAVNVITGEMSFFNNQEIEITPEHVMASAALPPGFPAVKIGDDYYWDGGIYANTPLVTVLDALPEQDTLCFVVDCFSLRGKMPTTMEEVEERQKDIRYASHSRRLTNVYTSRQNLQSAIDYLGKKLPAAVKKEPLVKDILKLGHAKRFSVVHVIYGSTPYAHSFKDYNFVHSAVDYRLKKGYNETKTILANPKWELPSKNALDCSIYGVSDKYYDQH